MLKRLILVLTLAITLISGATAFAESREIVVEIDGAVVEFDVKPQIINDRTMVPMRKIFESLGAKVEWVPEMERVIATYGTSVINMKINDNVFTVTDVLLEDIKEVELDVPAQIVEEDGIGRTLVPVRAVSEALGKKVDWDGENLKVIITSNEAGEEDA